MTDDARWTMPLVVRIERRSPPSHTDVLEAAALACLALGDDERSTGEWAAALQTWRAGRFRKVVRRARGAPWETAAALPGVTVRSGTAEVRAFPPRPAAELPKELTRLQVGGTDLVDPDPPAPPPVGAARLWLHPTLVMTTGKAAAQAGHGSMLLFDALDAPARSAWRSAGYPLGVRRASEVLWEALAASATAEVTDGGFTEIAPGSVTVRVTAPVGETAPDAP